MMLDLGELARDNRQISSRMEIAANRILSPTGLTGVQAQILLYILEHPESGVSSTQIHRESGYSKATISGLIKRLHEKGYVRIEPCVQDDRKKLLFATEKTRKVHTELLKLADGFCDQLYEGFSDEELTALWQMQKKLLRNLKVFHATQQEEEQKREESTATDRSF